MEPVVFKTDLTFWIWPSRSWDIAKKQTSKFFCGHGVLVFYYYLKCERFSISIYVVFYLNFTMLCTLGHGQDPSPIILLESLRYQNPNFKKDFEYSSSCMEISYMISKTKNTYITSSKSSWNILCTLWSYQRNWPTQYSNQWYWLLIILIDKLFSMHCSVCN